VIRVNAVIRIILLAVLCAGSAVTGAVAASHEVTPHVDARLIAERPTIAPGETITLAVRQLIARGWHTYWQNPGDAGEATRIAWDLPAGFQASDIAWPPPKRIDLGPLTNYGFEDEAVLLVDVTAPSHLSAGERVPLRAHVSWQVCKDICVPEEVELNLDLPVSATVSPPDPLWENVFSEARKALPRPLPSSASFVQKGDELLLVLEDREIAGAIRSVAFFPLKAGIITSSAPQTWVAGQTTPLLRLQAGSQFSGKSGAAALDRFDGILVARDRSGERSVFSVTAQRAAGAALEDFRPVSASLAFGLALLGGLILNLMPCVFPVLSMKVIALARLGGKEASAARREGILYGIGVVGGFLAVGGVLLALRHAGAQVGWGFQLQSPVFVAGLTLLFLAIALNLVGVFAFALPQIAVPLPHLHDLGAVLTGLLAVLVASPCTVPFMAAAVGAAAVLPPLLALTIFAGLGIGMAAPFVLLGSAPVLLRHLPKPGAWMNRMRQVMAFAMFASAAWLLWVLSAQTGRAGFALALSAALTLGFALWVLGERQRGAGAWSSWSWPAALVLAAVCTVMVSTAEPAAGSHGTTVIYEPYRPERLAQLRAAQRPVFLEVTADWCITCKVNERLVLDTAPFELAMKAHDVAYLRADWTRRDGAIARLLASYGRNGVPLYVFFGSGAPAGEVLPQVLTLDVVLGVLSTKSNTLAASGRVP